MKHHGICGIFQQVRGYDISSFYELSLAVEERKYRPDGQGYLETFEHLKSFI